MSERPGFRLTSQRRIILEELKKVKTHPTADELLQMVRARLPRISLATVYRNLEMMTEMGLVQRVHVAGESMRFDGNPENHCHIRCRNCGKVDDIPVESLKVEVDHANGYKVMGYSLEFIGLCPDCKPNEDNNSAGSFTAGA